MIGDTWGASVGNNGGGGSTGRHDVADALLAANLDWEGERWRDRAACRSTAADLFFPIGRTPGAIDQIRTAKSVCRSCEVRETCLLYALETNQDSGIWGGTSEDERRKLRRAWLARQQLRTLSPGTHWYAPSSGERSSPPSATAASAAEFLVTRQPVGDAT